MVKRTVLCSDEPHVFERELVALYRCGEYESALQMTLQSIHKFMDLRQLGFYWSARLHSRLGRADQALGALQAGLADGHWWSDVLLLHNDLSGLRDHEGFPDVLAESTRRAVIACGATNSKVIVRPPRSGNAKAPLLLALHGRGVEASKFAMHWRAASIEADVLLAVPQSTQMLADGLYCWDDFERGKREVLAAYREVALAYSFDPTRIILAGFAQGGDLAIRLTLDGTVEQARLFLAVAPTMRGVSADTHYVGAGQESRRSNTHTEGWIGVGALSNTRTGCEQFTQASCSQGHSVRLSLIEGMTDEFSHSVGARLGGEVVDLLGRSQ